MLVRAIMMVAMMGVALVDVAAAQRCNDTDDVGSVTFDNTLYQLTNDTSVVSMNASVIQTLIDTVAMESGCYQNSCMVSTYM